MLTFSTQIPPCGSTTRYNTEMGNKDNQMKERKISPSIKPDMIQILTVKTTHPSDPWPLCTFARVWG
jgi:hypothetical protein